MEFSSAIKVFKTTRRIGGVPADVRQFLVRIASVCEADAVVGAMIKLGDALNLRVLAEGVETEAQRKRLSELAATNCGLSDQQAHHRRRS
jgi:predicted signal transduction protein with EAL and GGDEF domain